MTLLTQNDEGECLLLSVAMLARVSPENIREWVFLRYQASFDRLALRAYLVPQYCYWKYLEACHVVCRKFIPSVGITRKDLHARELSKKRFGRLTGEGLILASFEDVGHVMAYSEGWIYDPNLDKPFRPFAWKKKFGWELVGLRVFPIRKEEKR